MLPATEKSGILKGAYDLANFPLLVLVKLSRIKFIILTVLDIRGRNLVATLELCLL